MTVSWSRPRSPSEPRMTALLLALLLALGAPAGARAGSYALIASPDVPVKQISLDEVRRIFLFKKTAWKGGVPITVLLPGDQLPARTFLLRSVYRRDEDGLRRFILEKLFRGEISLAPRVMDEDTDAIGYVTSGRGLVALVAHETHGLGNVRVLRVDGKLPGQPGYALAR